MYHIYCLNYGDERTSTITASFSNVGLADKVTYYKGYNIEDVKKANNYLPEHHPNAYKIWSVTMGHLEMMKLFLQTDHQYGIFCENDIYLHKHIKAKIPYYIDKMQELNLEILLLGYLLYRKDVELKKELLPTIYDIRFVPGAQMYLLTRAKCEEFVNKYNINYLINLQYDFNRYAVYPDMIYTVFGKKAAVHPMLAVEYVKENWQPWHNSDMGALTHHKSCYEYNITNDYL
jgi:hypothetical protein